MMVRAAASDRDLEQWPLLAPVLHFEADLTGPILVFADPLDPRLRGHRPAKSAFEGTRGKLAC